MDEELRALRKRAYGPDADIHLDPRAVARLRELEGFGRPEVPVPEEVDEPAAHAEVDAHAGQEKEPPRPVLSYLRAALTRLGRIRRSTALIALGAAALAALLIVALVLVERVQLDPLQVGAVQAARLSADPSFEPPAIFTPANGEPRVQVFEEFYGLRPVVSNRGLFGGGGDSVQCLTMFSSADLDRAAANSFAGFAMTGCQAGSFPPMTQFRVDAEGVPGQLVGAYSETTGVQFVYDGAHNEVVVFVSE